MIHYHCADINPHQKLIEGLAGRNLLVSHAYPRAVKIAHEIGQSVLLDNGAFTVWRQGHEPDWAGYYEWADKWLECPTTWAIIPDVIDGGEEIQNKLMDQWPHGERGAPVWHLDESIERLCSLVDGGWPRICLGSAGAYAKIASEPWLIRMFQAFNEVDRVFGKMPWLHGLRMQVVGHMFPFGSVDSADIARNNNRPQNTIKSMAERWDASQPPIRWHQRPIQQELIA